MQAQEPKHPFIGLWTRVTGFERADLAAALRDRAVVRGTLQRGTLHLATAAQFRAWRTPLQPVLSAGLRALGDRAAGLDVDATLAEARKLLDQGPRTFTELRDELQQRFPAVNERALGFTVRMLLPLVMVPTDDLWAFPSVARFTPAEAWLGEPLDADPPVAPLVRAYLAAFGPASVADVQTWCGLKQEVADAVTALRDELVVFRPQTGRRELFDLPDAPRPGSDAEAPVRFLPEFDNLLLSHADRTRVIADEHRGAVFTRNLRVRSTFLVDGFVAGTWTLARKRALATLTLVPIAKLRARDLRALTTEGEALARFVEPEAEDVAVVVGD